MARDTRLLVLRGAALAFWLACVVFIAVPSSHGGSRTKPFHQPAEPNLQVLRFHQ